MILCHQLISLIFLLIHKFQENKLVSSDLQNLLVKSCYSSLALCSSVTRHLLSLGTYCHSASTMFVSLSFNYVSITRLPLTCSTPIRFLICLAPTNFFLSLVFLIFLSVAFNRSSMHCVIIVLADSFTSLHYHNSTFPLGTFVTSC